MLDSVEIDHAQLNARKRAFDEFGYCVVENALPQAVAALRPARVATSTRSRNRSERCLFVWRGRSFISWSVS